MKVKMKFPFVIIALAAWAPAAGAVTPAEDIATTIMLRGYECGGKNVTDIEERTDAQGNRIIRATCPNGKRYEIDVVNGRLTVRPLD